MKQVSQGKQQGKKNRTTINDITNNPNRKPFKDVESRNIDSNLSNISSKKLEFTMKMFWKLRFTSTKVTERLKCRERKQEPAHDPKHTNLCVQVVSQHELAWALLEPAH